MKLVKVINQREKRRKNRVRAKIFGTPERPRLSVSRSNRHMSAQLIDDTKSKTLASATSAGLKGKLKGKKNKSSLAAAVGEAIAKKALELKISQAVFDKGAYKYHGRVKSLCDAARSAGLKI